MYLQQPAPEYPMKIEHVAIWCRDLEALRDFYVSHFGARPGRFYRNEAKGFESCFLSFESGARLELMRSRSIPDSADDSYSQATGLTHLALSVGSESEVDALTGRLSQAGFEVLDGPRRTGDGFYESVVLDPERNRLEITA
jgi:lactoylglutathione lyase